MGLAYIHYLVLITMHQQQWSGRNITYVINRTNQPESIEPFFYRIGKVNISNYANTSKVVNN